ncbi:MAG: addiction module antitoxin [Tardiphaga sp.]|jgi:antitoxin ParD1/3/4|nr:addiction module antitoxin [Tardiphaga sp.]
MSVDADLGEVLEKYVTDLVDSGLYNSRDDVLRDGLRFMHARDTRLADLHASILRGIADLDAGRGIPMDDVFDRIEANLKAKANAPQS